jgi:alpha-ketoglutarate-dependent taurine dioxygenase
MYQRQYIDSAQRFPDAPRLTPQHVAALDMFDELANSSALHFSMQLEPGDIQFVYNHALLHDRTAFVDWPEAARKRHLLRLWLAIPDDRPLAPVFATKLGTVTVGERGGIVVPETKLHVPL